MSEHIIKFTPAWDKRSTDPKKDYGIGSMSICFYAKGPLAVVQFRLNTRWFLKQNRESLLRLSDVRDVPETDPARLARIRSLEGLFGSRPPTRKICTCDYYTASEAGAPQGWDVGYHSPTALYEGQSPMDHCEFFTAPEQCFYDGSSLRAQEWVEPFLEGGTDWLWPTLDKELASIEARVQKQLAMQKQYS